MIPKGRRFCANKPESSLGTISTRPPRLRVLHPVARKSAWQQLPPQSAVRRREPSAGRWLD